MNKFFYFKLAAMNINKNRKTYIPYILTCIITVAMYYIITSLSLNEGLLSLPGASTIASTLFLGSRIVAIFAVIFLFYTNSFLVKRRKKEFGLYNILGMEKKHLSRVIGLETLYIAVIGLICGLGLGVLLDKAMYLLILKLIDMPVTLGFYFSWGATGQTMALFGVIFVLIFLNSLRQIHLAKPIELLRGGNVGEKEPKAKWLTALLGAVCLSIGYYMAVTIKDPVAALVFFFVAAILVMIGTYLLFTAGSILLLKLLRKNKRYYYKTRHFISVSGMIYRMKQNAVGLANICILSTAVLVMISSTSSMMFGLEDVVNTRYPYDISITSHGLEETERADMDERIARVQNRHQTELKDTIRYRYLSVTTIQNGSDFLTDVNNSEIMSGSVVNIFFVPLEDYNKITGQNKTLQDDEAFIYSNREGYGYSTLHVFDRTYRITQQLSSFLGNGLAEANVASTQFLVVKDIEAVQEDLIPAIRLYCGIDLNGTDEVKNAVYQELWAELIETAQLKGRVVLENKAEERVDFFTMYAGFFFLGIFLGVLFIMATILIIYYKQISEGYDDKERFAIMQKVGLSHSEVKRSIQSQILTVFFLPLLAAGVHVIFAFPLISKILAILSLMNTGLFVLCTIVCFLVFAVLYSIIYVLTAKTYYRIVSA